MVCRWLSSKPWDTHPALDRRLSFVTVPAIASWKRGYARRRSALERINNRIYNSFGFEKHFIRDQAKIKPRTGVGAGGHDGHGIGPCEGGTHRADAP